MFWIVGKEKNDLKKLKFRTPNPPQQEKKKVKKRKGKRS